MRLPLTTRLALWAVLILSVPAHAADRSRILNIYTWPEYFPRPIIERFEKQTGIHVNYTVFDSPDTAETALSVGSSNYDIVTMNASPHLAREIPSGFWKKLDTAKIPNARNADPDVLKLLTRADPRNAYAVPWMWGTTGVIYNVDRLEAAIGSLPADPLELIFNPVTAALFAKCGISVLDSWQDILPLLAHYLGYPELSDAPAQLDAMTRKLQLVRPHLRRIATAGYYEQLADGELCVAIGYSGDAMIARRTLTETHSSVRLDYAYPRGVVPVFIDSLVIPSDSPNVDGALQFINFVMQPEVSAEVVRTIGFASGNAAAKPLLPRELRENPIVYPGADIRARMQTERVYSSDELRAYGRLWQRFKAGG